MLTCGAVDHLDLGLQGRLFVAFDDDGQATTLQLDQSTDRMHPHTLDEFTHQLFIELTTGPLQQDAKRRRGWHAGSITTVSGQRIVDVDDGAHPGVEIQLLAGQAIGVATAVEAFVMAGGDRHRDRTNPLGVFQDRDALIHMTLHDDEFVIGQFTRLMQDGVGDHDLAGVMQQAADGQIAQCWSLEIEETAEVGQ